jgi:histone deacetylase complex regulatory component SIN3
MTRGVSGNTRTRPYVRTRIHVSRHRSMQRVSIVHTQCVPPLQVAYLFREHDDLLEEFTYFLPDSQAPHRAAMERQRLAAVQREHEQSSRIQRRRADVAQPVCFLTIDLRSTFA